MNPAPKVSVIVPVYNAGTLLLETCASVLKQSMRELELIFVNDGSTDESPRILTTLSQEDRRIHVISQANKGIGGARNAGIHLARGEWIFFLDADDWISDSETLIQATSRAEETNADAVIPDLSFVLPPDPPHRFVVGLGGDRAPVITGMEALRASLNWNISGCALWRASLFDQWSYDETCRLFTDEVGTRQLFARSKRVAFSRGTYAYRQHPASSTHEPGLRSLDKLVADEMLFQLLRETGVPNSDIDLHLEAWFRRLWALALAVERFRETWPKEDVRIADQKIARAYAALDRPRTQRQLVRTRGMRSILQATSIAGGRQLFLLAVRTFSRMTKGRHS